MFNIELYVYRYDHLSKVLSRVLDERPDDVADVFEDISNEQKRSKFSSNVDTVQDRIDKSTEVALAEIQQKLYSVCIYFLFFYLTLLVLHLNNMIQTLLLQSK